MTVTAKALVPSKFIENIQSTQYTATNVSALIDAAVVFNGTAGAVTFSLYLVNTGNVAGTSNIFISRSLAAGEIYRCPEIVGQLLRNGDYIATIAGTASALTFRISGREIS